jgi:hypothetical protein
MVAESNGCAGVLSLHGHTVLFTGKTCFSGQWETKKECGRRVVERGAQSVDDESRKVTLLVIGDLSTQVVTDRVLQYSAKIIYVHEQRLRGRHICAVDGPGFTDLVNGREARCLSIQRGAGAKSILVSPGRTLGS